MGHPLLKRPDIQMKWFANPEHALKAAQSMGRGLILCEQLGPPETLLGFLGKVEPLAKDGTIGVICAWKGPIPANLPPFVFDSLPFPPPEKEYGRAIANALNLPDEEAKRFLVRLSLHDQDPPLTILASTLNITRTGLLIESNKRLTVGGRYDVLFTGLPSRLAPLLVKIVRQNPPRAGLTLQYYTAEFVDLKPSQRDQMAQALKMPELQADAARKLEPGGA
jgi:hypothetical protein